MGVVSGWLKRWRGIRLHIVARRVQGWSRVCMRRRGIEAAGKGRHTLARGNVSEPAGSDIEQLLVDGLEVSGHGICGRGVGRASCWIVLWIARHRNPLLGPLVGLHPVFRRLGHRARSWTSA